MESESRLTHSRLSTFRECPRKHYYAYELGWRTIDTPDYFRLGGAYHMGLELAGQGHDEATIMEAIRLNYANPPAHVAGDPDRLAAWFYEAVTCQCLVRGWLWRWANEPLQTVATEQAFDLPIRNPQTGAPTPVFTIAGKLDSLCNTADGGRLALREYKTTSDDIGPDSDYWLRLRIDSQVSTYYTACIDLGLPVETVIYDACRKPDIRPCAVSLTDDDGVVIVHDAQGERVRRKDNKGWRTTGDTSAGYIVQTRPMSLDEWGEKLMADIYSKPSRYYARREISRLSSDVDEYRHELWQQQHTIRAAQLDGRWYRNTAACAGRGRGKCPYFGVCTSGATIDTATIPDGFHAVDDVHQELTTT